LAPPEGAGPDGAAAAPNQPAEEDTFDWVVEMWIDPAWYEVQESPDPLPSPGLPEVIPLRGSSLLVGRTSNSRNIHPEIDCEADTGVSRRQAQLTTDGRRWWVEDLESANGTFVGPASGALPKDPIPVGVKRELAVDDRVYVGAWTRLVIRPATDEERDTLG
jgi:FHA domain